MTNTQKLRTLLGCIPLLLAGQWAQAENSLTGKLYALWGESDNAYKSPADLLDEQQDEYGVSLDSEYSNSLVNFTAGYSAREQRFSEESQINKSTLDGQSSLLIGKEYHPLDLRLTHSRSTLLKAPDQLDLTNNLDAREILSVAPTLRLRLGAADQLQLLTDATSVKFLENDLMDSKRQGLGLMLVHGISPIQRLQLLIQATDTDFDRLNEFNYTKRIAMLGYGVQLRKINYMVELGLNQSDPEIGVTETTPAYSISLGYQSANNSLELKTSETVTDSSMGNGNQPGVNSLPTSDGSGTELGQLQRRDSQGSWSYTGLCYSCTFTASLFAQSDDYLYEERQSQQAGSRISFGYAFSKASVLTLMYSQSKQDYSGDLLAQDYDIARTSAEYRYTFFGALSLRLFAEDEKRTGESPENEYQERYLAAGISYSF